MSMNGFKKHSGNKIELRNKAVLYG